MPAPARAEYPLVHFLATNVAWAETQDLVRRWEALVDSAYWAVEVGDFPDEPFYSLIVNGRRVGDFDDWPPTWSRPS